MRAADEIERWVVRRLAAAVGGNPDEIDPTATFARFGLASVEVVGLLGALEDWLGSPVEQTAVYQWPTPRRLARALAGIVDDTVPAAAAAPVLAVDPADPVVVVGLSCRFPGGGGNPGQFWQALADGVDGVTEVPAARWDVDRHYDPNPAAPGKSYTRHGAFLDDVAGWDAEFFGLSPKEALRTDPQQRLLMELVWEGLEDAGVPADGLAGSRTGLIVGLMDTGQYTRLQLDSAGRDCVTDPNFGLGCASSVAAGRIAHQLDLRGPAFTVDTACSSSLVAVHLAAQSLLRGEADLALAAGVALNVHPDFHVQACSMSMLSPQGRCATFDRRADGFAMGEGGGVVVLERLSDAVRNGHRIRAVLRGTAVNQDGRSNGLTAPNKAAQVDVIRAAIANAGLSPDQIGFVEAHGSGTPLGDAVELGALHEVFGARPAEQPLWVGAVKTNIGHALAAAGMAGLIKTILSLHNEQLPPNLHCEQPSDAVPADGTIRVLDARRPFAPVAGRRLAGVSSFGWSGTNAHVVVEQAPPADEPTAGRPWQVLTLSAQSPAALAEQARALADGPAAELADIAFTTQTGRARLGFRRALVCRDADDARRLLAAADLRPARVRGGHKPKVAFLLPGVGDQHVGMGRRLYETEPVFAEAFDLCADVVEGRCGVDLRPLLVAEPPKPSSSLAALVGRSSEPTDLLSRPEMIHPFVVAVELALTKLLAHWGITPDVVIGYSLGEYAAACVAGVFSVEDTMHLVTERARLVGELPAGAMLAVAASREQTEAVVGDLVDIAVVNGPAMTVVAGSVDAIGAAHERLRDNEIVHRFLRTTHAFHSDSLAPAQEPLRDLVSAAQRRPNRIPLACNVTGDWLTPGQAIDPGYWAEHLCRTVRFADGLSLLADCDVFVEIGPGGTLGALVRQNAVAAAHAPVLATMPTQLAGRDEREALLSVAAGLWEAGVDVDWAATHDGRRSLVELPTYPFQRKAFWPRPTTSAPAAIGGDHCYAPRWHRDSRRSAGVLEGALVVLTDQHGIGSRLVDLAKQAGLRAFEVQAPQVRTAQAADFHALLDELAKGTDPLHVVHMWSLLDSTFAGTAGRCRGAVDDAFGSLMPLVQAIGEKLPDRSVRLLTVSAGSADVLGDDVTDPQRAVVHGLGRVAEAEHPGLRWRGVDVDLGDEDAVAEQLLAELAIDEPTEPGGLAAWRHGRRWRRRYEPVATEKVESPWRADGVYLITGGTRGLGLALAKHLVANGVRRLALVARTPRAGDDIAALERAGAEVLVVAADAGVPLQLREAIRLSRKHFGALTGVVHCAGVPGEGLLQRKTHRQAEAVLAPKVLGVAPLLELVDVDTPPEERLELLVLYSSSVSVLGGLGESDYCAANSVLDAAAGSARISEHSRVVSVAWGPWRHDAWQSGDSELVGLSRQYREQFGFTDTDGTAVLDRILAGDERTVLALGQPLADAAEFWATLGDVDSLAAATASTDGDRYPRPALRTVCVPPRSTLEGRVAAVWEQYLGIDGIGVDDPFFDLGGNSLVGTAMVRALGQELSVAIPPAVLFHHPTVAGLARWVDERTGVQTDPQPQLALAASQARGARRRQARTFDRKRGQAK